MTADKRAEVSPVVFFSGEEAGAARTLLQKIIASTQPPDGTQLDQADLHKLAYDIYRARRERRHCLPTSLFGEPAWDMLLYLYCSSIGGQQLSITSLCMSADVPQTTALRWVNMLEEAGLVERKPHKTDRRSFTVNLTLLGSRQMASYMNRVAKYFLKRDH